MIDEDPKSEEILKPILRGRDIERYHAKWKNLWLIATIPSLGINIDDYPAIKKHLLLSGGEKLCQSGLRKKGKLITRSKTPHKWYELQNSCAYHAEFEREKIIYPNMTQFMPFMLDTTGKFTNDKTFMMTGSGLKYLTAVLNSKVAKKWILDNCPPLGNRGRELRKVFFASFPLPQISVAEQEPFENLVDSIIDKLTKGFNPSELESILNEMVYKLYRLSDEEIRVVNVIN